MIDATRIPTPEHVDVLGDTLFRSNNGCGPLWAKIVRYDENDLVLMERWRTPTGRRTRFYLPRRVLWSTKCGWKRVIDHKAKGEQ